MKKISKEEFLVGSSRYYNNRVIRQVGKLKVNEALSVDFDEWDGNKLIQDCVHSYAKREGKEFRTRMDKDSKTWLFLRVK